MHTLLAIDDEKLILDTFRFLYPKTEVVLSPAGTAAEGLRFFTESRPDVVILDIGLPDLSGLEALRRFREIDARVPIILITGHATAATAIEAMRLGAFDFVLKPIEPGALIELLNRAFEVSRLMRIPATVPDAATDDSGDTDEESIEPLIGRCPAMQEVYKAIGRIASQPVTTLILGESGTGKELVARAIYHYSRRADKPFLAINCAALSETLLESELFGHEKGAFTGADRRRIGKFEQCHGGTLFLDEVGDMSPLTQAKILRLLQLQEFERVGGTETIKTDVRIVAATNRDLEARVATGEFRDDLYYRLNVFTIRLPPLRCRGEDIQLLATRFLKKYSRDFEKPATVFSAEALAALLAYGWPGNIRELQSVVKQALLEATGPVIVPGFLPAALRPVTAPVQRVAVGESPNAESDLTSFIRARIAENSTSLHAEVLALVERRLLTEVLEYTSHNLSQCARILGISRPTLRSKLADVGLSVERSLADNRENGSSDLPVE